nr:MAG TPA: hypothetical protein [Caudoviricetes sp.]
MSHFLSLVFLTFSPHFATVIFNISSILLNSSRFLNPLSTKACLVFCYFEFTNSQYVKLIDDLTCFYYDI